MGDDAVDEENIALCCALGCINCGHYQDLDCFGCSGKVGLCCLNAEICCKPSAPCLFPLGCMGLKCENDGCSCFNVQCQMCQLVMMELFLATVGCMGLKCENDGCSCFNVQCQMCQLVMTGAFPCNSEVPVAVSILGLTLYPKVGCCVKIGEITGHEDYVDSEEMER
eukprot:CAMPEP_0195538290 /NCGR_PEP_ID=MMETSP0794_2-20130614/49451_1 /TAXON_ID=515487 /ORGANISM="Stephanopyxis turris, Strain CCMP 815" /LENGTH=166 /DNA_ID=CAMNT_0040672259 /DNA_START=50 /DNA_END=551 /DNA_ORIENTATION=+